MITRLSHFLSFIFSPLLVPSLAVWMACRVSVLALLPPATTWTLISVVFGLTCLFPLLSIAVMYKLKIVSDPGLNKRGERTIPFVVSALAYALCITFFVRIHAPGWLTWFAAGALLAIVVCCIVNFWWKISVHLTALGGLVALLLRIITDGQALLPPLPYLLIAIIATGAVGTARLVLSRHTLLQVAAGTLNGFLCVYLLTAF